MPPDTESKFDKIIGLARSQEIGGIAAWSLINFGLISDENHIKTAQKVMYDASYRDAKNDNTYSVAAQILSQEKICYVPLKGTVLKKLYPENWMRTSCDTDLLVHKSDFERALAALKKSGFDLAGDLCFHDVSLLYDDSNLELHFSICENAKNLDNVLKDVWDYTVQDEGYRYLETNDYYVFHHLAHMAYHFLAGGCGIRTFLDFWILSRNNYFNEENVFELCKKAGIDEFYKAVNEMVGVWFEGKPHTDITKKISKYIVTGGAYGFFPNNAAAYTVMKGGKAKYILSIAFPKLVNMKVLYPALNKRPYLLPFFYVYRVFQKTLGRGSESAMSKFSIISGQGDDFVEEVAYLLKTLKLDK